MDGYTCVWSGNIKDAITQCASWGSLTNDKIETSHDGSMIHLWVANECIDWGHRRRTGEYRINNLPVPVQTTTKKLKVSDLQPEMVVVNLPGKYDRLVVKSIDYVNTPNPPTYRVHFEGIDGWSYFDLNTVVEVLVGVDSMPIENNTSNTISASQLQIGMIVVDTEGKGILTVDSIQELMSYPPQYKVRFWGIKESRVYRADELVEIVN